jgi:hypothetical protein
MVHRNGSAMLGLPGRKVQQVDAALAGLLGTAVGAVAGVGGSYLTNTMGRAAEMQSWRRAKTEEAYTQCIRAMLQVLNLRSGFLRLADGTLQPVLSHEDQPKYFSALIDMRYWLGVAMIFASASSRTALAPVEEQLAVQVDRLLRGEGGVLGGLEKERGLVLKVGEGEAHDINATIRDAYREVVNAARRDVGLFVHV